MSTKETEALGSKPMKAKANNPVAQIHREAAAHDMEEAPSKPQVMSGWRWLRLVSGVVVAVMVYVSGDITARVMIERGYFRIDSPTARGLEFVYLPLKSLLDASRACRDAFESCAAFFVSRGYHLIQDSEGGHEAQAAIIACDPPGTTSATPQPREHAYE